MKCPRCKSEDITRSHRRTFEKIIQYVDPRTFYRCKECWTRFSNFENPMRLIAGIAAITVIILALIFIPLQFQKTPNESQRPSRADIAKLTPKKEEKTSVPPTVNPPSEQEILTQPDVTPDEINDTDKPELTETEQDLTIGIPESPDVKKAPPDREQEPVQKTVEIKKEESDQPESEPEKSFWKLKRVESEISKGKFSIIMRSDDPIEKCNSFYLDNPPRLITNIKGRWKYFYSNETEVNSDLVRKIRIGEHKDFISIVLDLKVKGLPPPAIQKISGGLVLTISE